MLDTNVVSELMRPTAHQAVYDWVEGHARADLYTTTIVQADILSGIMLLPSGRRRTLLEQDARRVFSEDFGGRVLAFDQAAAAAYALIAYALIAYALIAYALIIETRQASGRPLVGFDGLIAAMARAANVRLATRNVRDFENCGLDVVNPWELR